MDDTFFCDPHVFPPGLGLIFYFSGSYIPNGPFLFDLQSMLECLVKRVFRPGLNLASLLLQRGFVGIFALMSSQDAPVQRTAPEYTRLLKTVVAGMKD